MYDLKYINKLNNDIDKLIQHFKNNGKKVPHLTKITPDMNIIRNGVSKLVMLDRYSFKDTEKITLSLDDFVLLTVKDDPKYPARGYGYIWKINGDYVVVAVDVEFRHLLDPLEAESGLVTRHINEIEKPMELFYEQIAYRNAKGLAEVESTPEKQEYWFNLFYSELSQGNFVPAGRVLYGAGSATDVTYFNCYVLPFPKDSRDGLAEHRKVAAEIMSRGGGVGTNGSTLRPRNALARGVNGRSSGAVSWLHDLANLTNLIEQGGSRRGKIA